MSEDGISRRNTDPLWIQDHFLGTGHDEKTRNATATFVHRNSKNYLLTCRHVLDAIKDERNVPGAKFPTLALHLDRAVLNLSAFSANGIKIMAAAPHAARKEEEIDIAICELSDLHWTLLQEKKNKLAIDLDCWAPPDWSRVKFGLAAGYPDEHKNIVKIADQEKVGVRNTHVIAEFTNPPNSLQDNFTIYSELPNPHGYYFSGMSGGPLYAVEGDFDEVVEDDKLRPIGIVYEGVPASKYAPTGFFGPNDIYVQAIALTPERFDDWLARAVQGAHK